MTVCGTYLDLDLDHADVEQKTSEMLSQRWRLASRGEKKASSGVEPNKRAYQFSEILDFPCWELDEAGV
jgi:hypothetical protein